MKKKNIFYVLYTALIVIVSIVIVVMYKDVDEALYSNQSGIDERMVEYISSALPDLAFQVSQDEKTVNTFYEKNAKTAVILDSNFYYEVYNLDNGRVISNPQGVALKNANPEDYTFYLEICYNADGQMVYGEKNYQERILLSKIERNVTQFYKTDNLSAGFTEPKNLTLFFAVPKDIYSDGGIIDTMITHEQLIGFENYNPFTLLSLGISAFLMSLFIMFSPLTVLNEVKLFKAFRRLKGEWNYLFVFGILTYCVAFLPSLAMMTISKTLQSTLFSQGFAIDDSLLNALNAAAWMAYMVMVSVAVYDVKYLFGDGVWRFIKEDTMVGWLGCRLVGMMRVATSFDLTKEVNKQIAKLTACHLAVILVCCCLPLIGMILAMIYAGVLFVFLQKKASGIQADYQSVLQAIEYISSGHFDCVQSMDFGYFKELKPSLTKISSGFEEAVKEETKSQKMKTELISNVSHDLKTPLTGLTNYFELLETPDISAEKRSEYMEILKQYLNRLNLLIEDLFEVSKVNSGNISLNLTRLDLMELLGQVKAEYQEKMEEAGLEIIVHHTKPHILLNLDGEKTYRIFENLMNNIMKYALENTRVYIDVLTADKEVQVIFKNISKAPLDFDAAEITERFVQGDKSRHDGGSGLGLAIVKSFTEAQNGRFEVLMDGDLFKAQLTFMNPEAELEADV